MGLRPRTKRAKFIRFKSRELDRFLEIAVLCNNATLGRVSDEDTGDPMELALLRAGRLAGLERDELLNKSPEIVEHAFDTTTKMMATVHHNDGAYFFAIKGAPEAVLAKAERIAGEDSDAVMDEAMRAEWLARVDKLGADGLRVLAFAAHRKPASDGPPFESLTFLGLVGLEDPPRADVPDAISACHASRHSGGHDHWRPCSNSSQHCTRCGTWRRSAARHRRS